MSTTHSGMLNGSSTSGSRPTSQRRKSRTGRRIAARSSRTSDSSMSRNSRTGRVTASIHSMSGSMSREIASIAGRILAATHSFSGSSSPLNRAPNPSRGSRYLAPLVTAAISA